MLDLSKIAYVAPKLPRFEVNPDKFWKWWDNCNVPIMRNKPWTTATGHTKPARPDYGEFWNGVTIYQSGHSSLWTINDKPNADLFSELITDILNALPWYKVAGITLLSNNGAIPFHNDERPVAGSSNIYGPAAVRVMLFDDVENRTFQIQSETTNEIFTPDLRSGPNLFMFNDTVNFKHGAQKCISGRKIIIRIDGALLHPIQLAEYLTSQIAAGAYYGGI